MERCSFCNQESKDVFALIKSDSGVIICDNCISLCNVILSDKIEESRHGKSGHIVLKDDIVKMIPPDFALKYKIIPFDYKNGVLIIAGISSILISEISMNIRCYNADKVDKIGFITWPRESDIIKTINRYYSGKGK